MYKNFQLLIDLAILFVLLLLAYATLPLIFKVSIFVGALVSIILMFFLFIGLSAISLNIWKRKPRKYGERFFRTLFYDF